MKLFCYLFGFLLLMVNSFTFAQHKNYDLSTPQKFVESLCLIGEAPADTNAVDTFYEKNSALVIFSYDSAMIAARKSFESFKNSFKEVFPERIVNFEENEIDIKSTSISYDNTSVSFNFNASVISEQLATYKKGDFKFLSSKPISDTSFIISVVKYDKNKDIITVKEDGRYKIKMDAKSLVTMKKLTRSAKAFEKIFTKFYSDIETGRLTPKNYERIVMGWTRDYNKVLEAQQK